MANHALMWGFAMVALTAGAIASFVGLFAPPLPWTATAGGATFWPDAVPLRGTGLYDLDTVFSAGAAQGADIVTLVIVIPAALVLAFRSDPRGPLQPFLLSGLLTWLLYDYASLAFGTVVYNEMFLVYVTAMASAGLGFALALRAAARALPDLPAALPARSLGVFLLVSGLVTAIVWLLPLLGSIRAGTPPPYMAHYTGRVTDALDLGVIVPACLAGAVLLLRHRPAGLLLAVPLLTLEALLLPMILMQSLQQIRMGVSFTPVELAGPIGGFVLISGIAGYFLWRTIRAVAPSGSAGG
ncbi:hypothetical protein [Maritimibacter sp. HL-12]|uniref:hypothetical protein n=1 Tax=Maritimibacter sp. HL-12 TaxID=1162418 RepID=UPI000A0F1BD2|nr:hypothetical protein [Maritimibacter sp. HL-12]SMH30415.1 hypothetical protein SAMN05661107_0164 [Maritimibacter sp. HL-12]